MKKLLIFMLCFSCGDVEQSIFNLPGNFSWENVDGINYLTKIKNQFCGDCFIYSPIGALEIQLKIDYKIRADIDLSEQSIHNCLKISCSASGDDYGILKHLKNYGVVEENLSLINNWEYCFNCIGDVSNVPFYYVKDWKQFGDLDTPYEDRRQILMDSLQRGPLIISVANWNGFNFKSNSLYKKEVGECVDDGKHSGHSTLVVGYVNNGEYFVIKNSHGENSTILLKFDGGDKCGFADHIRQIDGVGIKYGLGMEFCNYDGDMDGDGISDPKDNCPWAKNSLQENYDGDLFGDVCDECPKTKNINNFFCLE